MRRLFLFFFLTLFGLLTFPASGASCDNSAANKGSQVKSVGDLFAKKHLTIEDANFAAIINQPLSKSNSGTGNGSSIVRAPDDLIHASVLEFHDRYHAILEIFESKEEFKSRYLLGPPPKQYSLLRILFRAIIAPNAP